MAERGLTDEEVKKAREAISMLASIATPKNTTRNSDGEELCREGADEERSRKGGGKNAVRFFPSRVVY